MVQTEKKANFLSCYLDYQEVKFIIELNACNWITTILKLQIIVFAKEMWRSYICLFSILKVI